MKQTLQPVPSPFRPRGCRRSHDPHDSLEWDRGEGIWLWDVQGRKYLDCLSGYSANNFGHCHPQLVSILHDQVTKLSFCPGAHSSERNLLEAELVSAVSESSSRHGLIQTDQAVWISTTGSRAIEIAWKIAHAYRPGRLVRFDLSYHGRSLATSCISDTKRASCVYGETDLPAFPSWEVAFPRCQPGECIEAECQKSLEEAEQLFRVRRSQISALLIEPAIGARGYFFAPANFFQQLTELARSFGILIISDEIQMGLGRMGELVASHAQSWNPDLMVLGKSLGGGLVPLSAVIGDRELMNGLPENIESETYAANPLSCRVGIEVLHLLNNTSAIQTSAIEHHRLRQGLDAFVPENWTVGTGSASAIDLQMLGGDPARPNELVAQLAEDGILVHLTGPERNRIAIIPPLTIGREETERLLHALRKAWSRMRLPSLTPSGKSSC